MFREYETVAILQPDTLEDGVHRFSHRAKEVMERQGGTLLKVENWGKRKLSYEIKKETKGVYLYYRYLGNAGLVEELERTLRISDMVLRYQTVKLADDVDVAARTVEDSARADFLAAADAAARALAEAAARGEAVEAEPEAEGEGEEAAAAAAAAAPASTEVSDEEAENEGEDAPEGQA
jgi:small subunit ribosomal protein S6